MRPRVMPALLAVAALCACGSWQRVGSEGRPEPAATVPQLFDPSAIYRAMGLIVGGAPLPYVASLRFLAGATPDSTLAVFALSLANQVLSFRRADSGFVAHYRVELALRHDSSVTRQIVRDATVRVRGFQETLRTDESVVFQQFLTVAPGVYTVSVVVRDPERQESARVDAVDTVPRFQAPALGGPVPVYEGKGRVRADAAPDLVVNPRGALSYGAESLRVYVEGYGLAPGTRLAARIVDADSVEVWRDTVPLGAGPVTTGQFVLSPGVLPVGRAAFRVEATGTALRAMTPILVTFSDQWAIANFEQMVDLLRYFARQDLVAKLAAAKPEERAEQWRAFYVASDPVPITPENEALDQYFHRVEIANRRFQEAGTAGWRTDRGEVLITLGEPDEAYDASNDVTPTSVRFIRWEYTTLRLSLYFQDLTGFGQYRLTPLSRSEYQRVLERVRRAQ